MIVQIDEAAFADAGLLFISGDHTASFFLPPEKAEGPRQEVKVRVKGEELHFAEFRSAAQRKVLARLGYSVE